MANEKQADIGNAYRLLEQFVKRYFLEGILVVLVVIAVIAATISWARAERAIDENKDLKAIVVGLQTSAPLQQRMYEETERECRLAQMEVDDFRIILHKAGLDPDHVGEKP